MRKEKDPSRIRIHNLLHEMDRIYLDPEPETSDFLLVNLILLSHDSYPACKDEVQHDEVSPAVWDYANFAIRNFNIPVQLMVGQWIHARLYLNKINEE